VKGKAPPLIFKGRWLQTIFSLETEGFVECMINLKFQITLLFRREVMIKK